MGPLLKHVSYRYVFPFACLFGIAAAIIFGHIRAIGRRRRARSASLALAKLHGYADFLSSTLGILRTDYGYRWFAFSVFTYGFGNLMIAPVIPIIQVDRLHISTNHIALLANLAQITAALAYFYWGRYVDRTAR